MRYMLLCYDDEAAWAKAGKPVHMAAMQTAVQITHELDAKGQYVRASPLQPMSTAISVRVRDGKLQTTDGPFTETREVLGGFYMIDAPNLDEAIAIAARHPGQRFGGVEIRPVLEIPNLPK
jgi:hypothetical protein